MQESNVHIDHAQHNINFLNTFKNNTEYTDWIITVSFYSAVHIIEAVIFIKQPDVDGKSFRNSEDYMLERKKLNDRISNHAARRFLVSRFFSEISSYYNLLDTKCHTARYFDYKITSGISAKALVYLNEIIKWSNVGFSTTYSSI